MKRRGPYKDLYVCYLNHDYIYVFLSDVIYITGRFAGRRLTYILEADAVMQSYTLMPYRPISRLHHKDYQTKVYAISYHVGLQFYRRGHKLSLKKQKGRNQVWKKNDLFGHPLKGYINHQYTISFNDIRLLWSFPFIFWTVLFFFFRRLMNHQHGQEHIYSWCNILTTAGKGCIPESRCCCWSNQNQSVISLRSVRQWQFFFPRSFPLMEPLAVSLSDPLCVSAQLKRILIWILFFNSLTRAWKEKKSALPSV